jgi:hypothetical protein
MECNLPFATRKQDASQCNQCYLLHTIRPSVTYHAAAIPGPLDTPLPSLPQDKIFATMISKTALFLKSIICGCG